LRIIDPRAQQAQLRFFPGRSKKRAAINFYQKIPFFIFKSFSILKDFVPWTR
jgi:hypothetical protein